MFLIYCYINNSIQILGEIEMNNTEKYYKHSGKIGLAGPIYMLILGALGASILGAIYGYAIYYIPIIYLNIFLTLGLGGIVGYIVGFSAKLGKVRNTSIVLFFGFLLGLFAEYVGWVSWIYASSEQSMLLLMPSSILNTIQMLSVDGVWSIFSSTPTGMALYAIWAIEALVIIGTSILVASMFISATPFCENCNRWIEEEDALLPLEAVSNPDDLKLKLEQGDYSALNALKSKGEEENVYTQINLLHCSSCEQNHFLSVKSVAVSLDSDNKEEKEESYIVENLIISSDTYRELKEQ